MFNLEKSIAKWREQMLAVGINAPVPLEELEIHLREDIERQVRSGFSEENAFKSAVWIIGQAHAIKNEFKKIERNIMKRRLVVAIGILILFLGVTMILPALGKHKRRNYAALSAGANYFSAPWADDEAFGLLLGTAFSIGGATVMLCGLKKCRA
jgi:hypothetical protein